MIEGKRPSDVQIQRALDRAGLESQMPDESEWREDVEALGVLAAALSQSQEKVKELDSQLSGHIEIVQRQNVKIGELEALVEDTRNLLGRARGTWGCSKDDSEPCDFCGEIDKALSLSSEKARRISEAEQRVIEANP